MRNDADIGKQLSNAATTLGMIAFSDHGEGKPVVLWPSLFTDHRLYDAMVGVLAKAGWRTIAIDGPGFSKSDPPAGLVQPERYADVIIEIADKLGLSKIAFAGCSWGGLIGAHLGVCHAERVTSLVLMNTPLLPSHGGHLLELWGTKLALRSMASGVAHSMLAPSTVSDPERLARFTAPFASFDSGAAAPTVDVTLRHSEGLEAVLPALQVPTTIMMGEKDTLYSTDTMLLVAKLAPNAKIIIVPDCGHIMPIEAPEAAVAALVESPV